MSEERKQEKAQRLMSKLEELRTRLENDTLSPLQRLSVKTKLDRITAKLNRRKNELDLQACKTEYENSKDLRMEATNDLLQGKFNELGPIDDQIDQETKDLDQLLSSAKRRQERNDSINEIGTDTRAQKALGGRTFTQIATPTELETKIAEKRKLIEQLNRKREAKEKEIAEIKQKHIENEMEKDAEHEKSLKEYKPSLWKTLKERASQTAGNIKNFFKDVSDERRIRKEAREATRELVRQAREQGKADKESNIYNNRVQKTEADFTEATNKAAEFRSRIGFEPAEQQPEQAAEEQVEAETIEKGENGGGQEPADE